MAHKTRDIKKLNDVAPFYKQLVGYFPESINKNYTEIESFYNFMVENRGNYFKDKINKLDMKIIDWNQEKRRLNWL